MNYQLIGGNYEFIHVADWNNGSLVFFKDLQMRNGQIKSVCSEPCSKGYYKVMMKKSFAVNKFILLTIFCRLFKQLVENQRKDVAGFVQFAKKTNFW